MPRNHIKAMEREVSKSSEHKGIKHFAQINTLMTQTNVEVKPISRNLGDLRVALTTRGVKVSQQEAKLPLQKTMESITVTSQSVQ